MTLYDWPRVAAFGRVIPKNKIYEQTGAKRALKKLFVSEVDRIVWSYKLAPETVNLSATKSVAEIQVFQVFARTEPLSQGVLRAIDKAIPFPLIFEVIHGGRIKLAAAYKRPNEADNDRWVWGDYFEGEWRSEDSARATFPVALDMGVLYERLLEPLIATESGRLVNNVKEKTQVTVAEVDAYSQLSIEERIAQMERIQSYTRDVERIKKKLSREKQFNKRVAINAELRLAKQKLEKLASGIYSAKITSN